MNYRVILAVLVLAPIPSLTEAAKAAPADAAGEYAKHFDALRKLSVAVAQAMPAGEYNFRPHPESMDFGALISHIAATNYQFCAGLKDSDAPALPVPGEKDAIVKFLSDSFEYCSAVIPSLTTEQSNKRTARQMGAFPNGKSFLRCTSTSRITVVRRKFTFAIRALDHRPT
jgi:hypothetical protein